MLIVTLLVVPRVWLTKRLVKRSQTLNDLFEHLSILALLSPLMLQPCLSQGQALLESCDLSTHLLYEGVLHHVVLSETCSLIPEALVFLFKFIDCLVHLLLLGEAQSSLMQRLVHHLRAHHLLRLLCLALGLERELATSLPENANCLDTVWRLGLRVE